MKTIPFFALFALLFLMSCNKDDDQSVDINEAFELDYRATKEFEDGNLSITFENLVEESRCPADAICIWEGRAVVEIKVQEEEEVAMYILATSNSMNGDSLLTFQHNNYEVKLLGVWPFPGVLPGPGPVTNEDYNVELKITAE